MAQPKVGPTTRASRTRSRPPLVRPAATSSRSEAYLATLEEAWQQHLAPRASDAPTIVSLFAGCGGSSLGYSMAGFREVLAVEWDDHAVECFRLNFPEVSVCHGDIAALSVEECLSLAGLERGILDVLDGSPPCQGFSTAGKRQLDDPRNNLFREFVRLLGGLQPRAFVMENVSGMVKGKMKLVFAEALRALKGCGYRVSARLLDAANYGVPQYRQRMIFIGLREDLGIEPSHPRGSARLVPLNVALPWCRRVGAVSSKTGFGHVTAGYRPSPTLMRGGANGMNSTQFSIEAETDISQYAIGAEWERLGVGEQSDKYFSLVRSDPDQPCGTLTKVGSTKSAAAVTHPSECRKFSTAELKRIGSFPDAFQFCGSWSQAWALIGNSVPPLFMRAIARHVRDILGR